MTENLLEEIEKLAPFGQANPEPILGIKKIRLLWKNKEGGFWAFSIFNSQWNGTSLWDCVENGRRCPPEETEIDIATRLQWNTWNQKKRLQMVLVAWKTS